MRFSIRDLLLWTTIAAIYAAMAGAINSRGLLDYEVLLSPVAIMPLMMLMMCLISHIRLGRPLVSFRRKQSYWTHAGLICVSTVIIGKSLTGGHPLAVGLLLALALNHIMFEAMSRITLGLNGVIFAITLLAWKDYRFEMEPTTNQLHITSLSKIKKKWGHWSTSLTIPAEHLEEVRAILEAKQGATDAKTE